MADNDKPKETQGKPYPTFPIRNSTKTNKIGIIINLDKIFLKKLSIKVIKP